MSLPFKKVAREELSKLSVYVDDTSPTSTKYFRVSDVPEVLQKGKNLLRISAHPTNLVEGSQILVDVRDSSGNPIYFEIPDYLEEDKSRAISIWIYHDKGDDNTANGEATITLVGTSNVGNNGEPVPQRFKGNPNVRWQTTVNVDRIRKNTSSVLFKAKQTPTIQISESIESYRNQPQSGNELLSVSQTGTDASYIYKGETPIVQLTDGTTFNNEMIDASIVLSNYIEPATPVSKYDNPLSDTFFSSSISKLINNTTAVLLNEYTTSFDNRDELTHTYGKIASANYSIQYVRSGSNVVTENERSFANITLSNVDPIAGVVDKVKVLIKSDGLPGEFELLNEVTVPYSASFSVKVPVPSENLKDPKLLKIQYLNSVGEISRTETITAPFVFQGGNSYIGGDKNLISGSMFISNALGTGIEMGGVSSGFIRSVGFDGQTSASLGKGPGGFIIYSGSGNMLIGDDVLHGVGMQMIGDNDDRHFIFTTDDGGLLDVKTDKFFIGTNNTQFISGSDSNIEISSSLFHLDPKNNSLVIGAGTVINADLSANQIFTPATIGGSQSTILNASASITSDGFAKFVSASIGGFEISTSQINSANDNLILKDSGQITGSNVLFSGGTIAGFEVASTQINSINDNLILKSSGQITASDGFLFGDKASSQYVQYDDGNLVVRGDLSVDQIFTPATIAGSPADITNASSSITSDGFASFKSASIGGWDITTASIEGGNLLMRPEGILQTRDFASGLKGWKISSEGNGTAEFENVRIRGTMRTTTFEKESVNAVGGQLWIANSSTLTGSILATAATMSVKNIKGFVNGEILLAKKVDNTGFQTEYILVNSSSLEGDQSNEDENYGRLYVTRGYGSGSSGDYVGDIGSISQSYEDGQVVVSTGKIGTGYIKLNANPSDQATPFMDIVERTGSGLYDVALAARLGDLSGLANSDYVFGSSAPGYGLATNNVYLQGGIKANTGSIGGINMEAGKLYNGNGTWANLNTGFYIDSASNFSLGDRLTWNGTSLVVRGQIQLADGTGVEEAINAVTESSTARALSIGVDSQVYAFDNSADTTATPDTIVFTISQQNLTGTITTSDITITKDGGSTITTPTLGGVVTNGSGQLSGSLSFSGESLTKSDLPITIEVSKDSLLDTTTIFKVEGGADGAAGADGVSTTGFSIEYSTSTTEADPGSGKFRFNAADPAAATEVYISETDLDGLGVAPLLNQLTSSTNTPNKSIITFRQEANQSYYESAYVTDQTDNGSWRTVDITHIDKNGWANLSNGDSTFMAIAVLGDSGAAGADGVDGVTTFLTNEAHTFAAATDGTIVSFVGGSTDMEVFEGVTNVTSNYTISASNGAGVSSSLAPPKTVNIGALANDSGSVIITATSASVSLSKTMSLVKSKQGITGADGTSAKLLIGSLDSQVFAFDDTADTSADPTSIIFSFQQQNLSGTISSSDITISTAGGNVTNFDFDNNDVSSGTGIVSGSISFSGALNTGGLNSTKSNLPVTITATKDGLEDSVKIFKVEGGTNGENGAAGADGVSAITAFLTNDSHTLPISSSDEVISFTGASTDIIVFQGTSDVTNDYTISRTAPAHMTTTLVGDTVTLTNSTTPFTGSIVITATSESVSLAKTMSISEARQGVTGAQGDDNQDFTWANENLTGVGPIASPGLLMTSNVFGFHDGISGSNGSLDDFTSYLDSDGNFYLGSGSSEAQFVWDNTTKELLVSGSNANITVDRFFLGGASQFVSGSNGNLEISSSNFHLQPGGDAILNGTIYAEAGRIASFIISSSNFDALRLVEEFTPIVGTTATFIASEFGDGSTPSIPTEVDNRATITITNVTSSRIAVSERTNATTLQLGTSTFSEKEDYEIEYSGSFTFNSGKVTFVSESILTKFATGSYGAVSGGFYSLGKPEGEFTTYSSDDFLSGVEGLYAFAIEAFHPTKFNSAPNDLTALNPFFGSLATSNALSLDERVEFFPANNSDLEFFIKPDLRMISSLTGSSTSIVVSSSDSKDYISGWHVESGPPEFILQDVWNAGSFVEGFSSLTNSTNPTEDFINAYWEASAGAYDPPTQFIWIYSASVDDQRSGEPLTGNIFYNFFLTASFGAVADQPDSELLPPLATATVYSGQSITPSEYNTISSSFFLFDPGAEGTLGYGSQLEMQNARLAGGGEEAASFVTQSYAPLRGVTSTPVDWQTHVNSGAGPSANLNYGVPGETAVSNYYAAYLEPGWTLHPTVEAIINGIDTNTEAYPNSYPNSWAEIGISGSAHHSTFVPDDNDTTPSHGVPLTLYNNFVREKYTISKEVKLYDAIWPLDIAESGSFQPIGTSFSTEIINALTSSGASTAINITSRLDSTRVQTDLTNAELAELQILYATTAANDEVAGTRRSYSVTHESTKQFSEGRVSTGTQSGSFVEKVTFTISGSGELSSSNFFLDDKGDITGSQVNFSGGTISGSALNISANRFEFKNRNGRIFGNPNNFIISSSLLSLDNNNLEVKGDIRASTGFIQETFLGGKIVETGVRHPSVANLTYQLPFIEAWTTSSTDKRLDITGSDSSDKFAGSHGNWRLGGFIKSQTQYLVTGSTFDGVGYPDEFKSWYGISDLTTDYKFIDDTNVFNVSDASASLSPTLVGTQLVFNSASFTRTGSAVLETITSEFINISESLNNNYRNTHLQFAARGTTHPYTDGFTGFFPQYQVDIISGSTTYFSKKYKDENATHRTWKVFDIPITDILTTGATNNTDTSVAKEFKVKLSMNYSGSSSTGTLGTDVNGIGWALTEMRMVEPVRAISIDTQTLHFKDTYLTWDGKLSTAHKGNFVPISTSSNSALSESIYTLGTADKRWKTAYLKDAVSTLSDRRLKSNIEISDLGLSFIDSLKPVKYNMNDDTTHYGLIAQEVSQSLSEFSVHSFGGYDDDGSYLSLRYSEFISPMIKAIQDQQQIIKTLQNRIEILESGSNN